MIENKVKLLTISEVAEMFNLKNTKTNKPSTHTLRYWEKKFKELSPTIVLNGRRYYTKKDIEVVKMIIFLLKDNGLTINGAIKLMNSKTKDLDATKVSSIKGNYHKNFIKTKSRLILKKIKKLNG